MITVKVIQNRGETGLRKPGTLYLLNEQLAEKYQMILVTHNKSTMEAADTLYGVTMEEPGISKIVSVRLN